MAYKLLTCDFTESYLDTRAVRYKGTVESKGTAVKFEIVIHIDLQGDWVRIVRRDLHFDGKLQYANDGESCYDRQPKKPWYMFWQPTTPLDRPLPEELHKYIIDYMERCAFHYYLDAYIKETKDKECLEKAFAEIS